MPRCEAAATDRQRDTGSGRPLLDKLGVRQGSAVQVLGLESETWFLNELRSRGADTGARPPLDLVFVLVRGPDDLARLAGLRASIRENGAIWVVRAKGRERAVTEVDIIEAARRQGLVDNKISSFSDSLAAMRLVVPVAMRQGRDRP